MNLQDILEKTKKKSESIKSNRKPPSIAMDFRPYDTDLDELKNREQIDNKPITKLETNQKQIDNKVRKLFAKKEQTDNKVVTKLETQSVTNWKQTDNKLESKIDLQSFSSITGIQRAILLVLYEECKVNRSRHTREMTLEFILNNLFEIGVNTTVGSIKTSLRRLEEKNSISRILFKNGRGGWSQYELSEQIYRDIMAMYEHGLRNKQVTNRKQTDNKQESEPITKPVTSFSSSSGNNIKDTTYTPERENESLPNEWEDIDFYELVNIEFKKGHIRQLYRHGGLEPNMLQASINHYAFDILKNKKLEQIKTDPINYFMGIMKRAGYYNAPPNYEDPREKAKRQFLEDQSKRAKALLEAERDLFNHYFSMWYDKLSNQEKLDLVGKDELIDRRMVTQSDKLKKYYKENFWAEQYLKIKND